MTENVSLDSIINEALTELNSFEQSDVNSQDEETTDSVVDSDPVADTEDSVEEVEDSESEIEEDEEESDESVTDGEKYSVKVDGESIEVTLDELKAGYSRQSHFTKSMQALKEEKEAFEVETQQFSEAIEQITQLDTAWENDPIDVLTQLTASTENPGFTLGLLIRSLAANDLLPAEALEYFGIDEKTKQEYTQENELTKLRKEVSERDRLEKELEQRNYTTQQEKAIEQTIQQFDNQINEIIEEEGIELKTELAQATFKAEILTYAQDNNILDMKKAYAAMAYEKSKADRAKAKKNAASSEKKTATKVISKGGASAGGVSPVQNSKADLRSVIEQTMRELNS
jgi:hypothetical protein